MENVTFSTTNNLPISKGLWNFAAREEAHLWTSLTLPYKDFYLGNFGGDIRVTQMVNIG
jgi:hypothetical protein